MKSNIGARELDILYEDGPCLVVNKAAGVLTQAPPGIDSLEVQLKRWLGARVGIEAVDYLGIPHRLDRPVSGAIVFALTPRACRRLSDQFEERRVVKSYWAFVEGRVEPAEGSWSDYLLKVHGMAQARVVSADDSGARFALLHYHVILTNGQGSWLEIHLETGRTHQIRIQAASRGHPVMGDFQYGSQVGFGEPYEDLRLRGIALHARQLAFAHPTTRQEVAIVAPLPESWNPLELPSELLR
jgi:RluA family pseudouridine synthase